MLCFILDENNNDMEDEEEKEEEGVEENKDKKKEKKQKTKRQESSTSISFDQSLPSSHEVRYLQLSDVMRKLVFGAVQPGKTQTSLLSYRE